MYTVSRTDTFAKLFFIISFVGLFMYVFLALYTFRATLFTKTQTKYFQKKIQSLPDVEDGAPLQPQDDMSVKYILLWTINNEENPIGEGQDPFVRYNCLHQNCYITTNKELLHDYTEFHAIIFNSSYLKRWKKTDLPRRRSFDQKYVFFSTYSSEASIICNPQADDFFNWTWTYKLYSDILNPFFEVRDLKGDVVAPSAEVIWEKYADDDIDLMAFDKTTKTKAMATIWTKCNSGVGIHLKKIVELMNPYLEKHNLTFDIFGCENNICDANCLKNIADNYLFYWVHELSAAEDYVSDEIMNAIETNTVPVVFGLADYDKFLPPGSYIRMHQMSLDGLAPTIHYAIQNRNVYLNFFRWKKYYTFNRTPKYRGLCQLCNNLNNRFLMEKHSHYQMFRKWWYSGPLKERCLKRVTDNEPLWPVWKKSWQNKSQQIIMKEYEKLFDMVM